MPLVSILHASDSTPNQPFQLDRDTRKYIHLRSKHVITEYTADGEQKETPRYENLELCNIHDLYNE